MTTDIAFVKLVLTYYLCNKFTTNISDKNSDILNKVIVIYLLIYLWFI